MATQRSSIVLALYALFALVMTYPLATHFSTHVPGSETWAFDEYTFVWNFWWFKHAIFDLGVNPLHTDFTFYPLGVNLVLYTFTLLNAVLALPLEFVFGYAVASNTLLLFALISAGFGAMLLARDLLARAERFRETPRGLLDLAAFGAGIAFAFTSSRFVYASLGHYNFASSQWLPFYALYFMRVLRAPRAKNVALAGIFAGLAMLTDTTYAVFIALWSALYLLFVWRERQIARGWIARVILAAGIAGALAAPLIIPSLIEIATAEYALPGWGHAEKLLVDLVGFITPTSLHPLNRQWTQELDLVRQGNARFVDVNTSFLGYATLALALIGAWNFRRHLRAWISAAALFALLALGPVLHINGKSGFDFDGLTVTFPMPFLLLHYIPFLKENRVPNRFGILVILALTVLIAFALAWLAARLKNQTARLAIYGLLITLLVFEHLAIPLPLSDARVPEVYRQIAQEPGDFAILSLPLGWRNSFTTQGAEDTRTQYYQSVHGKRLLSGNTSRNPPALFEYFDRIGLFHSLTQIELYQPVAPAELARDQADAPGLLAFYDIRYVVVNAAVPGRVPYSDTRGAVIEYIQNVLPLGEKIFDRDGVIAYRVHQARLPARQEIAFGNDSARPYQGEGWDRDEIIADAPAQWANRREARVLFPLREIADYEITLRALSFSAKQTLELIVNDQPIQKFEMQTGWDDYRVTLPARVLRSGVNHLVLKFGNVARPREVLPANFAIGKTGVTSPVEIVVNAGETGSIKIAGKEASPQKRGYNVVVINPANGALISVRAFDTVNDRAESRAFTDFIAQIPNGHIVAIASQDAVAANLGDRAALAFREIGGQIDIRQEPTRTHALVGVKGAVPGTALEQSQDGASFIWVGPSQDTRSLAAAVSGIVIEKK